MTPLTFTADLADINLPPAEDDRLSGIIERGADVMRCLGCSLHDIADLAAEAVEMAGHGTWPVMLHAEDDGSGPVTVTLAVLTAATVGEG